MSESAPAAVRASRPIAPRAPRAWPTRDSLCWLALVAALFTCSQLAFVVPRLGLSWDEVVYISQVSMRAPAAYFGPPRARGVPLLVAPVTLLTGSVVALRVYLSIASGLCLFLALLAWRSMRPAWILALAGAAYATLWVALYYGPQAMPDEWVAFSALAGVGLFLRATGAGDRAVAAVAGGPAVAGVAAGADSPFRAVGPAVGPAGMPAFGPAGRPAGQPARRWLAGLAGCVAAAALVRPGDAVFLSAALVVATLAVRAWRRWQLLVAIAAGLVAGCAEWVAEAYLRFGGPLARLHGAGAEQGGFGLHFAIWDELRAVNGPTLCRPCTIGLRYPELSLWWFALPVVALLGVLAARRAGRLGSSLLPALCGLCIAFQYLFLINYAAPRFLLPAYALLTIPVADGLGWLLTGVRADMRPLTQVAVVFGLAAQIVVQQVVLEHQVAEKVVFFGDYTRIAADLHHLGIRAPCLIKGEQEIPIAYYAGCGSAASVPAALRAGEPVALLAYAHAHLPAYAHGWRRHRLPGVRTSTLKLIAYLPPR